MKFFSAIVASAFVLLSLPVGAQTAVVKTTPIANFQKLGPDESIDLNNEIRSKMGGSFVGLSDGVVAYNFKDLGSPTVAVLIHGYSVPSFVWEGIASRLNKAGVSTLTYDLYGHGLSDRPQKEFTRELYARQLTELIEKLVPKKKVQLAGWSMGEMIAANYAGNHVNKVETVFMVSPSGLPIDVGITGGTAIIPIISDISYSLLGGRGLSKAQQEFFEELRGFDVHMRSFEPQMQYKGFQLAMLSTLRKMDTDNFCL